MYAFNSRACIVRGAARCTPKICGHANATRSFSTTPSAHLPPALATKPDNSAQTSAASPGRRLNNRITSSYGGVSILSAAEIAKQRSQASGKEAEYTVDLGYLQESPSSFASQLAANRVRSVLSASKPASARPVKPAYENRKESDNRIPNTDISRAAPRSANDVITKRDLMAKDFMEKANKSKSQEGIKGLEKKTEKVIQSPGSSHVQRNLQGQHKPSLHRHGSLETKTSSKRTQSPLKTQSSLETQAPLENQDSLPETQAPVETHNTPQTQSESEMAGQPIAGRRGLDPLVEEDITYETLENGGDDKDFIGLLNPDIHLTDLDALFSQNRKLQLHQPSSRRSKSAHKRHGDHVRYAPSIGADLSTVVHGNMDPLKHAWLLLGRKRGSTLVARQKTLEVVESAIGSTRKTITKS